MFKEIKKLYVVSKKLCLTHTDNFNYSQIIKDFVIFKKVEKTINISEIIEQELTYVKDGIKISKLFNTDISVK